MELKLKFRIHLGVIMVVFLSADFSFACDWVSPSFCNTSLLKPDDVIVSGKIVDTMPHGIKVKVIDIFRGQDNRDTIIIWDGTDFDCNGLFSMAAKGLGQMNDTIIVILPVIDSLENIWDMPGDYRRPSYFGYTPSLIVRNDTVRGSIAGNWQAEISKLSYGDFVTYWSEHSDNCEVAKIDSLKIIPYNPTSADTVKIIAYTFQTGTPCNLVDYDVSIINPVITINTHYPPGLLNALCNSTDTVIIAVLSAGCYEAYYFMTDTLLPITYDIDTISFCVQQPSGLQITDYSEERIKVYPNPFSTTTTIFIDDEQLTSPVEIRMYDILGRENRRITKIISNAISLTRNNLTCGLYFIRVVSNDKIIYSKKIIIE